MNLLNEELDRIKSVMGVLKEDTAGAPQMNMNLRKAVDILDFLKINSSQIEKMLIEISKLAENQIIDFGLLERGLRKILLKKGDKKKNVSDYLGKIITSLKYRERSGYGVEPESEDYEFEVEEPSIVPKKVFKKELYELQIELVKLQEWLAKTGKTVIIVFEGRDSDGKGSTIKKFTENLNPRYFNIIALGVPTTEDRKDWWNRYRNQIKPGMINLFDRSWYNRGLVEPVMGYGTPEEYEDLMKNVANFENDLTKDGDTIMVKNRLGVPKEIKEQAERSTYLPPLIDHPMKLTHNNSTPYLSFEHESLILGGKHNHHDGDICLDVLNIQNNKYELSLNF